MKATAVIVLVVLVLLVVVALVKTVKVIPQASAAIVERFGRYTRTLHAGLNILVPFIDRIRQMIDLREQVVPFPPQPVITEDNLVVQIDTVIYFQVTDPRAATYEIANYIQAIEQLTITTLRNIIGGMDLEQTLTSREEINAGLRGVLDEATGRWGIRVNRVELKAIEPPPSIQDSMEKQMRAERDKRAAILTAEGHQRSQVLTAEGDKEAAVLRAEGERQAAVIRAEGEARAIETVFEAIHAGEVDNKLLAYQYLQMLPKIAEGSSNKLWILPSEVTRALEGIGDAVGNLSSNGSGPAHRVPQVPVEEEPAWPGSGTPAAPVRKPPAGNGASSAPRPPAEPPAVPAQAPSEPPRRGGPSAADVEPPHIERGHRPPR
ncbi:SPFH domain-containing protein [Embleya sp. NPDC008237]|uniref:SPFH domain-containing protein n=1 Tax=Embleya sp. NPDC008237 TaxID=3363978 RepID=UPI0036EDFEF5